MRRGDLRRQRRGIEPQMILRAIRSLNPVIRPVIGKLSAGGAHIVRRDIVRRDQTCLCAELRRHV